MQLFLVLAVATLCLGLFTQAVHGQFVQLPTLPNSFSAILEGNIYERNLTVEIREYYDSENNRVRLDTSRQGSHITQLSFYNTNTRYTITNRATCATSPANSSRNALFNPLDPSTGRLRSTQDLFFASKNLNFTDGGITKARGIDCNRYTTTVHESTVGRDGHTITMHFLLEWYFSAPNWSFDDLGAVPVRIAVTGTRVDAADGVVHAFNHFYEWVSFTPGQPDAVVFQIPRSVLCVDPTAKPFPKFPDSFRTSIEITDRQRRSTYEQREFFDYTKNKLRIDVFQGQDTTTVYFDVSNKVQYTLNNFMTCTVSPFDPTLVRGLYDPTSSHLRSASESWVISLNYTYAGVTRYRNIDVDHWFAHSIRVFPSFGQVNLTVISYIAVPDWSIRSTSEIVPVAQTLQGTVKNLTSGVVAPVDIEYNYLNFRPGPTTDVTIFQLPTTCPGSAPASSGSTSDNTISSSTAAGVIVLVAVCSAAITALIMYLACIRPKPIRHVELNELR